jgi:transcriptional regulator with XRE-family HTH domain
MPRPLERFAPGAGSVGARVAAERQRLGLSQQAVADRLGVVRNTYRQIERVTDPKLSTLLALAEAAGMDLRTIAPELYGTQTEEHDRDGRQS